MSFHSSREMYTFRYVVKYGIEWRDASGISTFTLTFFLCDVQTMASGGSVGLIFRQVIHCGNCVVGLYNDNTHAYTQKKPGN
ncbi:hypothetical protein GHT06_017770 [Daphnia sinensis]|uniref:Uncharacterized protein n=1 Tax=Daphnia sinensis TaxID=1820382 RepID=A0AAD5PU32_9CRUS|nr:hypothetical protein GHT06_017770 [Daphnia sinensis]